MSQPPARSSTGCWTCRLRRKKCDESPQVCKACLTLGLNCWGYGAKPHWIDNGDLERQYLREMKVVVKKNSILNRSYQRMNLSTLQLSSPDSSGQSPLTSIFSCQQDSSAISSTGLVTTTAGKVLNDAEFPGKDDEQVDDNDDDNECMSRDEEPSSDQLLGSGRDSSLIADSSGDISDERLFQQQYLHIFHNILPEDSATLGTSSPPQPIPTGEEVIRLITYYLDRVFYLQYPFYDASIHGGRAWLVEQLLRVKPLCHIAMALSACHRYSLLSPGTTQGRSLWDQVQDNHQSLLQELQHHISELEALGKSKNPECVLEVLACISQLIDFEQSFCRGTTDSRIHLQATSPLLAILESHNKPLFVRHLGSSSPAPEASYLSVSSPLEDGVIAHRFLTTTFIHFDIISSASTGLDHVFQEDHERMIAELQINLDETIGCENWAMMSIMKISTLRNWKREYSASGRLSLKELVDRADVIEKYINAQLEDYVINKDLVEAEDSQCSPPILNDRQGKVRRVVTAIFGYSALTYLHTTVSGAHANLPEIQQSVDNTIEAFKSLPNPQLLRSLAWPLCVTGCMSLEHHSFFEELFKDPLPKSQAYINSWRIMDVIRECWKQREETGNPSDWMTAMDSLGYQIILV